MALLPGLLPKIASLAFQPAVLAAGVVTGVAVGAVGVGTGVIQVTDPAPRNTALYECPGSGRVVTSIEPNQSVLVTARSADGQWLQIYVGAAGVERGWAPARSLQLKAAPDSLPIEDCTPAGTDAPAPTGIDAPSLPATVVPSESLAVPSAAATTGPGATPSPTPSPTKTPKPTPTAGPTPTPGATFPGPYLSELTLQDIPKDSETGTYIFYPPGCSGVYTQAPFTVRASDPDGIGAVLLWYQPFDRPWQSLYMESEGGDLYYGAFGSDGSWGPGRVLYYVEAYDSVEDSATLYPDNQHILVMEYCSD